MPHKDPAKRRAYNVAQHRARYAANPKAHYLKVQQRKKETRDWLRSMRVQCCRCPENHPACLDFHHRDRTQKTITLAQALFWGRKRLEAEIAKCDVICSNCHRKEHWEENAGVA